MYPRLLTIDIKENFFLFGPRGTGKSTLLHSLFESKSTLYFDLLLPELEDEFSRSPQTLRAKVMGAPPHITHVVIDEIQKVPKLLDVVHSLIEETTMIFVLTGSSARKLKRGGANLLAGRAQVLELYPFSAFELQDDFDLERALAFGTLPKAATANSEQSRRRFLTAYALTYLKEEIQVEQVVRNLDPFRRFLEVAAQMSGKILNYASLARDVGVDEKTVKAYFQILEDTLIGRYLEPFHTSVRKRISKKNKFYLFDTGVQRALSRSLSIPVSEGTSAYGELFEIFFINECFKLNHYFEKDFSFHYLQTRDEVEIDLVVERPGAPLLLIEIKSATRIEPRHLASLRSIGKDFPAAQRVCVARVAIPENHDGILVLPWRMALERYFQGS
ncbi:MAG: ATPase [Spirochaetae bacterium HGW-Spirochaetae-7]|jgi:predicted AAA+ superfamily ATPase|nr:MAG: ATPase [Spirochaetae bacterium HGW-Spirochaetae-7]